MDEWIKIDPIWLIRKWEFCDPENFVILRKEDNIVIFFLNF